MTYHPRHRAPPIPYPAPRGHLGGLAPSQTVDFWRDLQDNTPGRLGSRVMLRQAREPDLQPYVKDITGEGCHG